MNNVCVSLRSQIYLLLNNIHQYLSTVLMCQYLADSMFALELGTDIFVWGRHAGDGLSIK